jgi:hypothetical protein
MAANLTQSEIRKILRNEFATNLNKFELLRAISDLVNINRNIGQEFILRVLSRRPEFSQYDIIIDSLVRQVGLFPYVEQDVLSLKDSIAYEVHKPEGLDQNIVFHHAQAEVYYSLMRGDNIVISAPTSFGKSLIIDAIVATKKHKNIAVIVPTIALIDETRKRLSKFKQVYKVITHPSQETAERNIYVLTQERAIDIIQQVQIDFFVIDEFYKLSPNKTDTERCYILNQVFYHLVKSGAQFYLLGPNIEEVTTELLSNVSFKFIKTDYKTVVSERHIVRVSENQNATEKLISLASSLTEPTLIFCQSPASANKVANAILLSGLFNSQHDNSEIVEWLKENYHENWILPNCLYHGVGIHHGKIPRAIAQKCIKLFNEEKINYLICTSTIIEGVNTKAKNVIIFDNKIARTKFDYFTFNNICGRSGRMFSHFIGNIYLFHEPPMAELPLVDFPIFTQQDDTPANLLININEEDLKPDSKKKLQKYNDQTLLSNEILKQNSFIDLDLQLKAAEAIDKNVNKIYSNLSWNNIPTNDQLKLVCNLIWEFFVNSNKRISGVSSGDQLHFRINQFRESGNLKNFISLFTKNESSLDKINDGIELALDIQRNWINFQFPRYLMALNSIANHILTKRGLPIGDFSYYASLVECYFTAPYVISLDEYGLPMQISLKVGSLINFEGSIDDSLHKLRTFNPERKELSKIEKEFIYELKEYI